MIEYVKIILMAIFQGAAEFLPISSSGHLEVLGTAFNIAEKDRFSLSIVLHCGTLFSMLCFYFKDVTGLFLQKKWKVILMVIIASIPAGIAGVCIKLAGIEEKYFHSLYLVGGAFIVTGVLLLLLRMMQKKETSYIPLEKISYSSALFIGVMQMFAIIPGISRSGSTIFAGAKSKLSPEENAAFSFFMAMAAIGGATLLEIISCVKSGKIAAASGLNISHYCVGLIFSFVSGYAALTVLLKLLKSKKLGFFGIYMFFAGTFTILLKTAGLL